MSNDPRDVTRRAPFGEPSPQDLIELAREQLDMDVAFVARIDERHTTVRWADGDLTSFGLEIGRPVVAEETVSKMILDGRLPSLIADTSVDPRSRALGVIRSLRIGSLLGVPIVFADGRIYGILGCARHEPDASLRDRDVRFLTVLATTMVQAIEREEEDAERLREEVDRIRGALEGDVVSIVFQPIVELSSEVVVGFEALARFGAEPRRAPDRWFADAARHDLGVNLELLAARAALRRLADLPGRCWLALNASVETVVSAELAALVSGVAAERLVLEVSDHARVDDFSELRAAMGVLRAQGVRFALDDAGGGFDSLSHIHEMGPDIIKIDTVVVRGIDADPVRRAVATSLVAFGEEMEAEVVAEGVETHEEAAALRALGVRYAQGNLFGAPLPL